MSDTESNSEYVPLSESDSDSSYDDTSESEIESERSLDESGLDLSETWCEISVDGHHQPPPRFPFVGVPGCTFHLADNLDVLGYFSLFFDDDLLNLIVTESNRYAEQQPGSSTNVWYPVTKEEMLIFLAINILQGIVKKPEERMYWSTNEILSTPVFPKLMSLKRYLQIKRYLHFTNNEDYDPETHQNPKLYKIWPVFENINKKCSSLYIPERHITIDESLMLYKGRLGWVQYIPTKRARFGIKSYLLCEAKSGYLFSSIIYTGKGTVICDKYKDMPMSSQVVLSLLGPLLDKGYCLTTDNFYTSPQLADFLVKHKTDIYGTMRINRKEIPTEMKNKKLKKGEIIAYRRGKVMVMKWHDKKDICLLSTIHSTEKVSVNKTDKDGNVIMKPEVVNDYNNTMGGVDRLDQHLQDYPVIKKRGKKFYKKIFFHLLDISVWNSFILYQKNGVLRNHLDFRKTLVQRLIEKFHSHKIIQKVGRPKQPGPLRLTERHFPEYLPPTEKKTAPTRCCAVCCNKRDNKGKKRRKETRYWCKSCNVGLCAVPCFKIYHTELNF